MLWRLAGGLGLLLLGLGMLGLPGIPKAITGALILVGGIALLAGI